MLEDLTISNGLGWSPDGRTMYLVDSGPRVIHAFAFDGDRRHHLRRQVLVTVPEDVGAPDGMTVDAAGDLWVAIYGGGRVNRYAPDGSLREVYAIPAGSARAARSAAPACTGSTSPPRPRAGATNSVAPIHPPASSTGSTPTRPADRQRRSVPTPPGGRTSPDRVLGENPVTLDPEATPPAAPLER